MESVLLGGEASKKRALREKGVLMKEASGRSVDKPGNGSCGSQGDNLEGPKHRKLLEVGTARRSYER